MTDHTYHLTLITDAKLRAKLADGVADADALALHLDQAKVHFHFKSEHALDPGVLDGVTRVNWSDEQEVGRVLYRVASPDECENGALRLSDLLDEPRKLARVVARLFEEEDEWEFHDEDIVMLTEFLQENDAETEISAESTTDALGLFLVQLSLALQAAADNDAWLYVARDSG